MANLMLHAAPSPSNASAASSVPSAPAPRAAADPSVDVQPIYRDAKIDAIYDAVKSKRNVLLHGMGGSGKSFALRCVLCRLVREDKTRVACTASTGCAAVGYAEMEPLRGSTVHRWAGMGYANESIPELCTKILHNTMAKRRIHQTQILAIDEISMISGSFWTKLNAVLGAVLERPDLPFGGMQIIACGDFLQLPPVTGGWVFQRPEWTACNFRVFKFTEPYRFRTDMRFHELLLRARFGACTASDEALLRSRLHIPGSPPERADFSVVKATKFFSLKRDADQLNMRELAALPGPSTVFCATDSMDKPNFNASSISKNTKGQKCRQRQKIPLTDLNGAWATMLDHAIPREIVLKVGAQVMLKKNLNVEIGLVNGSRGVVESLSPDALWARVHFVNDMTITVPRQVWSVGDAETQASRLQIPLILAWGLTIHSSQGATLDVAECDIGHSVFAEGQAYVAMSRVRTLGGLRLSEYTPKAVKCDADAAAYVSRIEAECV